MRCEFSEGEQATLKLGIYAPALFRKYYQTVHWRQVRARTLRATPDCTRCGQRRANQVHHRTYRFFEERLSDVEAICKQCHWAAHGRKF
jgi:5-methylcytosine-specific restriction endonuclease McrA